MGSTNQRRMLWLSFGLSAVCLAAIFFFIDPRAVWQALRDVQPLELLWTGVFIVAYMGLRAVRWRYLLDGGPSLARVFHIQNIGYMLTQLLPFRLGDVARAVLIGNVPPVSVAQGFSTMVVERVLDMLVVIIMLPIAAARIETLPDWLRSGAQLSTWLAVGATALLVIAANFRQPTLGLLRRFRLPDRLIDIVDQLLVGLVTLTRWRSGLQIAAWSVLTWAPITVAYFFALRAVNIDATPTMAAVTVCAAALSIAAPSSPSQAGVFHAAMTVLLTTVFGQPEAQAAGFAFVYHAFNFLMLMILGVIGLLRSGTTFSRVLATSRAFTDRRTKPNA